MNPKQVIELVEKWLEDPSSVSADAIAAAADDTDATRAAHTDAAYAAWAAAAYADDTHAARAGTWAAARTDAAAKHVAEYHELTKG